MTGDQNVQSSEIAIAIKWACAFVATTWIGIPGAIQTLLVLMAFDYLTGLIVAGMEGRLCSRHGWRGLGRKTLMLILVAAAHNVAKPLHLAVDPGSGVAIGLCVNEMISIVENCNDAGVPIPPLLVQLLVKSRQLTGRGRTAAEVRAELTKGQGAGGSLT